MGWVDDLEKATKTTRYGLAKLMGLRPTHGYRLPQQNKINFKALCSVAEIIGWQKLGKILDRHFKKKGGKSGEC